MTPIVLYSLLLSLMLIISMRKKSNIVGIILVFSYAVISYFSLIAADKPLIQYTTTIDSQYFSHYKALFMIIAYGIFFKPFLIKRKGFNDAKITCSLNDNYTLFAWVYILSTMYAIGIYLPRAYSLYRSGRWAINRAVFIAGENEAVYSNIIGKLMLNFSGYFLIAALIIGFIMIREERHKKTGIVLIMTIIVSEVSRDVYLSTRGLLVEFILLIMALYLFFYSDIDKGTRRFVIIITICALAIIVPYIIDVTVSRFMGAAQNSVIYYLGQPPFVFGLEAAELKQPMLGRFAFGVLFGDEKFPQDMSNWVHGFYTFIGWLYADWGYIGTLIIGVLFSFFMSKAIKKESYSLPDLFIIFSAYYTLLQGAFTIGRTKCYDLISYVVIYIFLRFVLNKYLFTFGGKTIRFSRIKKNKMKG